MFHADRDKFKCVKFRNEFLSYLYDGETIVEACALMKVNPAAFGLARRDNPEFDAEVRAAQAFRVEVMTDKLERINEYEGDAIMAGVISKNIQWLASKRYRAIYGDKVDHNINVQVNIRAAIDAARQRAITIEHDKPLNVIDVATDSTSDAQAPALIDAGEIDPLS